MVTKKKLEELKDAIAQADTMQELKNLMEPLDAKDRNQLTHEVKLATDRIVLGE